MVPVLMVLSLTLVTAWVMLTQQQRATIDGHLTREAVELQVLAEKAIDPATGVPFTAVDGVLSLYIQRTVPDPNETMFVMVDGRVLARTTDTPPVRLDQDPVFLAQVSKAAVASFGNFQTEVGNARYIVVPITGDSNQGALVGVIFSDLESKQIQDLLFRFAEIVLLALIAAMAVGWLVAGRALRPITQIRDTAHEIGESDLSKRISPSSAGSELNQLVDEFNAMLDRIEESFATSKQFVDDAGHELRTPLTVITGHLELINTDPSSEKSSLLIIQDEVARMSRIVKDLQTLTKSSQPDFVVRAEVSLRDLGDELLVKASHLENRVWRLGEIPDLRWSLDRQRITQAVMQLSENASKATTKSDIIELDIQVIDNELEISVSDSGPGIPLENRENIQRRFVRGNSKTSGDQGAGLGLAVVAAIAAGHNGELVISDSNLGGAKLTLRILR